MGVLIETISWVAMSVCASCPLDLVVILTAPKNATYPGGRVIIYHACGGLCIAVLFLWLLPSSLCPAVAMPGCMSHIQQNIRAASLFWISSDLAHA